MTEDTREFQPTSIPSRIATRIRQRILAGDILPGQRIKEHSFAREIGVSQGPVREALIQLEHEGFVTRHRNRGTTVTQLSSQEINDMVRVRISLEVLAIELAKKRLNSKNSMFLDQAVESMRAAVEHHSVDEFSKTDFAFHETIWKMAGNQELLKMLKSLCSRVFAFGTIRSTSTGWQVLPSYADMHSDLAQSILNDDFPTCSEKIREHIEYFWGEKRHVVR